MGYMQGRALHVDKHLSNIAINYRPTGFIADRIFPVVTVEKQTDMIKTYNQGDLFREDNALRAPGTRANVISTQVSSTAYSCVNYALRENITVEDRANADPIFVADLESGAVMRIQDKLAVGWDRRVATQVFNTSNVGTSANVSSSWTDLVNSNPLGNIWTMMDNVELATGYRPNRVVFGTNAWRYFSRNDDVINKVNATGVTGAGLPATVEQAARLLQVEEINVGMSYYNSAGEGITQNITPIWTPHVLVYYAPPAPSVQVPSFGYTLRWAANGLANMRVERHPFDSNIKADGIEVGYYQDELVTASVLGALVANVTSSQ